MQMMSVEQLFVQAGAVIGLVSVVWTLLNNKIDRIGKKADEAVTQKTFDDYAKRVDDARREQWSKIDEFQRSLVEVERIMAKNHADVMASLNGALIDLIRQGKKNGPSS